VTTDETQLAEHTDRTADVCRLELTALGDARPRAAPNARTRKAVSTVHDIRTDIRRRSRLTSRGFGTKLNQIAATSVMDVTLQFVSVTVSVFMPSGGWMMRVWRRGEDARPQVSIDSIVTN
jgi:hypothetical protein